MPPLGPFPAFKVIKLRVYVHYPAKLAYLASPRTASSATAKALALIGFSKPAGHHARIDDEKSPIDDSWYVSTAVRNHWDAAVSWMYAREVCRPVMWTVDKVRFALDNGWVDEDLMWGHLHVPHADVVMRYESLENDLNEFLNEGGLGPVRIPLVNDSKERDGRDYKQFHTRATRDYIQDRFGDEIEQLGYEF